MVLDKGGLRSHVTTACQMRQVDAISVVPITTLVDTLMYTTTRFVSHCLIGYAGDSNMK